MSTGIAKKEVKHLGGSIVEFKEIQRDGKSFGIVEGHIATFGIDRRDDRFSPGAFDKSIEELKRVGKTQLPFKDFHGRTIGGFPMELLREDNKGLFGVGEINLEIEQGRDAYALAKQGVYDSFSIGFIPKDVDFIDEIREIREAEIVEGSLLDVPMNLDARVTEVKELATKLGIDIDKMTDNERKGFVEHIEIYLKKMDDNNADNKALSIDNIKELDERTLEGMFKKGVRFEGKAAKALVSVIKESNLRDAVKDSDRDGSGNWDGVLDKLDVITKSISTEEN